MVEREDARPSRQEAAPLGGGGDAEGPGGVPGPPVDPRSAPLSRSPSSSRSPSLSIGRLAEATGIPPATLRTWERRYGRPRPRRLPSGHRRYTPAQLLRLRRVAEGLALGLRPGPLLLADEAELGRLLAAARARRPPRPGEGLSEEERGLLLGAARSFDRRAIEERLAAWARARPAVRWLEGRLAPFLEEVGRAWARGRLEVRHEHLLSELALDRLRARRGGLARRARTPYRGSILFANLPGERHVLGLQMAALVCEEARVEPCVLGADTPVEEIARAARERRVDAVGIGVSLAGRGTRTERALTRLRDALLPEAPLLVGGAGARARRRPRARRDVVVHCDSLSALRAWLGTLPASGDGRRPKDEGR